MFYIKDYGFKRDEIGGVKMVTPEGEKVAFTIDDWCSLIASVSILGDTREGLDEAFKFHIKGPAEK